MLCFHPVLLSLLVLFSIVYYLLFYLFICTFVLFILILIISIVIIIIIIYLFSPFYFWFFVIVVLKARAQIVAQSRPDLGPFSAGPFRSNSDPTQAKKPSNQQACLTRPRLFSPMRMHKASMPSPSTKRLLLQAQACFLLCWIPSASPSVVHFNLLHATTTPPSRVIFSCMCFIHSCSCNTSRHASHSHLQTFVYSNICQLQPACCTASLVFAHPLRLA